MKRYSIELTAMQWGLIALDIGGSENRSESTDDLMSLIKVVLDDSMNSEFELPYNIKDVSDDSPV